MTCARRGTAGWVGRPLGPIPPSTLAWSPRSFGFGHVREPDAVAARLLAGLAARSPLLAGAGTVSADVDDTIIEVHADAGAGRRVRRLEGPLTTPPSIAASADAAPAGRRSRFAGSC